CEVESDRARVELLAEIGFVHQPVDSVLDGGADFFEIDQVDQGMIGGFYTGRKPCTEHLGQGFHRECGFFDAGGSVMAGAPSAAGTLGGKEPVDGQRQTLRPNRGDGRGGAGGEQDAGGAPETAVPGADATESASP